MNPTRRALCGLGIAGVPMAMLGPRAFSAEQDTAGTPDAFLAYLVEDTKRNCRLAGRPGRGRGKSVRRLGGNVEVLTAYLLTRETTAGVKDVLERRLREDGIDGLALRVRDALPGRAAALAAEYAVALPEHVEHATMTAAIDNLRKYGPPRLLGIRRWFEREADRIEQLEGRAGAPVVIRQTPGNDFGPPGWSAGLGDPPDISCWDLGVIMACLYLVIELQPELASSLGPILAGVGVVYAIVCNPWTT